MQHQKTLTLQKNFDYVKKILNRQNSVRTGYAHVVCKENRSVKDYCQLTGKFRELAHNKLILYTQKSQSSFVPILSRNFSGYDGHINFEKNVKKAFEKSFEIRGEDNIAKSSENYMSVKIRSLMFLIPTNCWMLVWIIYLQI